MSTLANPDPEHQTPESQFQSMYDFDRKMFLREMSNAALDIQIHKKQLYEHEKVLDAIRRNVEEHLPLKNGGKCTVNVLLQKF